jgi:hypothetical protein
MGYSIHMQIGSIVQPLLLSSVLLITVAGCGLMNNQLVVYDQQGIRIGTEKDPTVNRVSPPAFNSHPAELSAEKMQPLLKVIQVSGWSGTLIGMVARPQPVTLFTDKELAAIASPLATAFQKAGPEERVFFSLAKPDVTYSEDRTEGFLFLRGRYLHVVLTDHSSVLRADTAGGDLKDIRDTKGMKLGVAVPAQQAMVPDAEEPRWAPFETVHVSLNVKEVLALQDLRPSARADRDTVVPPAAAGNLGENGRTHDDLQVQIRELTSSNVELRGRLDEQTKRMQMLTDELEQLRLDLEKSKTRKQVPHKPPAQ